MIISERLGFAFIHIPKCAGSTVREQVAGIDSEAVVFRGWDHHPVLGDIDRMHLPLDALREHFPEEFEAVRRLDSYAVLRDPADRFRSALSEHVKTYHGKRLSEFSEAELAPILSDVVDAVGAGGSILPRRFVHFTPQVHYIRLEDVMVRGFAIERLSELFTALSAHTGGRFDAQARANQDFAFRLKGIEALTWRANAALKRLLPYDLYQAVKRRGKPLLARQQRPAPTAAPLLRHRIADFVHEHYAEDFALHKAALASPADVSSLDTAGSRRVADGLTAAQPRRSTTVEDGYLGSSRIGRSRG